MSFVGDLLERKLPERQLPPTSQLIDCSCSGDGRDSTVCVKELLSKIDQKMCTSSCVRPPSWAAPVTQPACLLTQRLGSLFSSRKDSLVNMAMRVGINGFGRIGACHYTQARCARLPALPREPVDRAMGRLHSPPADRRTAWRAGSSQIP